MVRESAAKVQFQVELEAASSPGVTLANQCVENGENLYDSEKYREAMMQ